MDSKVVYRSGTNNRIIAGVCGGLAEYFQIDPTIVRVAWILITLAYGIGFLAYIIAIVIIPERKEEKGSSNSGQTQDGWKDQASYDPQKSRTVVGIIFIIIGVVLGGRIIFGWFDFRYLIPAVLILIGVLLLFNGWRHKS